MPPLKFANAAALAEAVKAARGDCRDALKRDKETRSLWIVSRGAWVRTMGKNGDASNETDSWDYKPTVRLFNELAELRNNPEVSAVYIEGGFNGAASGQDYADGAYDPWIGEWSVTLWVRED